MWETRERKIWSPQTHTKKKEALGIREKKKQSFILYINVYIFIWFIGAQVLLSKLGVSLVYIHYTNVALPLSFTNFSISFVDSIAKRCNKELTRKVYGKNRQKQKENQALREYWGKAKITSIYINIYLCIYACKCKSSRFYTRER